MLVESVLATPGATLAGALDIPGSPALGQDAAAFLGQPCGVAVTDDIRAALSNADVLIDFTRPEGTMAHLAVARELGVRMVIGTTGFDESQKALLKEAARSIALVFAPNMSVGVNATFKLLEVAAKILNSALRMGEVLAEALGKELKDCAVYAREGHTGERQEGTIGFATIRGGDIVGDHTVMFAGIGERIEITHKSSSRVSYAQGSVRAARFLMDKPAGLYDMQDVLGLK